MTAPEPRGISGWARVVRSTALLRFGALLANLCSGALLAHAVGPAGRGVVAAVQIGPLLCGWLFSLGAADGLARQISDPTERIAMSRLFGAWLLILVPLGVLAVGFLEAGIPLLLHGQSAHTQYLARLFAVSAFGSVLSEISWGATLGQERFVLYNLLRLLPSFIIASGYGVTDGMGLLTPAVALIISLIANQFAFLYALGTLCQRGMVKWPSAREFRACLSVGGRLYGADLSEVVNARLDMLILPAVVGASAVGFYSVATNLSFIVVTLAGSAGQLLLPVATRSREAALSVTRLTLAGTTALAMAAAVAVACASPEAVTRLYGAQFRPSIGLLLILLPGSILYAGAQTMIPAVIAEGRLLAASACQAAGILITVPGLLLLVPRWGVGGAAITSSIAYSVVFVMSLAVHRAALRVRYRDYLPSRNEIRLLGDTARSVVAGNGVRKFAKIVGGGNAGD